MESPTIPETPPEPSDSVDPRSSLGRTILVALATAAVTVIGLLLVFSGGDDPATPAETEAVSAVASLAFQTEDGGTATLASYQGQPMVVNFFASWCAPCRAEMPEIEAAHLANADGVKFLGISHDLDIATWQTFVDETEITFETVFQPDTEIWTELDAKGMPSTAFVSSDGEVVYLYTGVLNERLLQDLIDEHLVGQEVGA